MKNSISIRTSNALKKSGGLAVMAGLLALSLANPAAAQSSPPMYGSGPSSGYIGLNAGQSNFRLPGGVGFNNDSRSNAYSLYGGGYFSEYFGAELGYNSFGRVNRGGGSSRADGISISLVGKAPLNQEFNLLGRIGTTYGRSDVSAAVGSGIVPGGASGWGVSYGIGAEYAFTPQVSMVVNYDEYRIRFANAGREKISTTTIGARYRF